MNTPNFKKSEVKIVGMTCQSCEFLLETKLKAVKGVVSVNVIQKLGKAYIKADANNLPTERDIESAIQDAGYRIGRSSEDIPQTDEPGRKKWMEIGASFLIIFALYKILQAFDIISYASALASASTLGGIFVIGLVAGTSSCLAVTGGLLLSMAAKYNEVNLSSTRWQKFKPLLSFNIGRVVSYFFFGGLVGVLGQAITFSPRMTGLMNIAVAMIMLSLALSILKIIPKGTLGFRLVPRSVSHRIAGLAESKHPAAPFSLGALTFFLPCGFTQSLQLAALASGSFLTGSLTMGIFALGTLPALLGISTISATAKGTFSRLFLRFSGTLVLVLALFNLNSGFLLAGVDVRNALASAFSAEAEVAAAKDKNVTIAEDGTQIINLRVTAYGYSPRSFTIEAGKPTKVRATATRDAGGCTSVLVVPAFGLSEYLDPGSEATVGPFIPKKNFLITCSMGMVRANVKVVKPA